MRNKALSVNFVISGKWKHIECVWSVDRPSESMYEALTEIRRLFCMCALAVVSDFLCLSTFVNLK